MKKKEEKFHPATGLHISIYLTDSEMYEVKITEEIENGKSIHMFADVNHVGGHIFAPAVEATPAGLNMSIIPLILKDGTKNDMPKAAEELIAFKDDIDEIYDFLKEIGFVKYSSLKDYPA